MHQDINVAQMIFESGLFVSGSISSIVVGDKNIEFLWHGIRHFFIFASVVLDGPVGVKFACDEVTNYYSMHP